MTDLLDQALEAHGGRTRWEGVREVVAQTSADGLAFASKLKPWSLRNLEFRIDAAEPRTVLSPYPGPGRRGVFEPDVVRVEREGGGMLAERGGTGMSSISCTAVPAELST